MSRATLTPDRLRTFRAGGENLDLPVDVLGRARFRATLERSTVYATQSDDPTAAIPMGGTAILFNTRTWIGSRDAGFWEQISPGAVTKTLQEADVRALQNHNPDLLLARTNPAMRNAGVATLTLTATVDGLVTDISSAPTSYARDLAILLDRGDISQMSFAFDPISWTREQLADGNLLITITELRLYDVSIVTYPAYEETDAGLRAAAFEAICRTNGFDPDAVTRGFLTGGDMPDLRGQRAARSVPPMSDEWRAATDATSKRTRFTGQQRDLNGWTFSDLYSLLDDAVVDMCSSDDFNAYWYVWLVDVSDTWLVYYDCRPSSPDAALWQCDYTVEADGNVTLGTPVEVVAKTTYLPAVDEPDPVADDQPMGDPQMMSTSHTLALRTLALRTDFAEAG